MSESGPDTAVQSAGRSGEGGAGWLSPKPADPNREVVRPSGGTSGLTELGAVYRTAGQVGMKERRRFGGRRPTSEIGATKHKRPPGGARRPLARSARISHTTVIGRRPTAAR